MAKQLTTKPDNSGKMALTAKSLRVMIVGLAVLVPKTLRSSTTLCLISAAWWLPLS